MALNFVLRQAQDEDNPRLPDAYGRQITVGRLVCWDYTQTGGSGDTETGITRFIAFLCRGGEFGCEGLEAMYYNGREIPQFSSTGVANWIFHPGTVTRQIEPREFTVQNKEDLLQCPGHGFTGADFVRLRAIDGMLPTGLSEMIKYRVREEDPDSFKLLDGTSSIVNITDDGSGALIVWNAIAGKDDPVQGAPTQIAGIDYTFPGICYVEGTLTTDNLPPNTAPDGQKFIVKCRKVADYDSSGVQQPAPAFSANNALVAADILLKELKMPASRIDWTSWNAFRNACDQMIWHRVNSASSFTTGPGLTGRYYNRVGTAVPPVFSSATLVKTRAGEDVNFTWGDEAPDTGVNTDWFLVRWDGKLRPAYSETYTLKVNSDNGFRLWIGNVEDSDTPLMDFWTDEVHTNKTAAIALTKNELVKIRMEYFDGEGPASISLLWSSASTPESTVPRSRMYPADHQVKRYESHLAIPSAMTAWQALEEVMERAPGWHWQDVNGKIKFIGPDRTPVHRFDYDPGVPHTKYNISSKTFEASPRPPEERANYQRYEFRDVEAVAFAQSYLEVHRTELREVQGGLPSDTPLVRLGVMTRSLAERIAETRMRLLSDPERQFTLRGQLDSYHVSKGDRVRLSHFLSGDNHAAPAECIVTSETTGGKADEKTYTLLPVSFPFYEDEEAD